MIETAAVLLFLVAAVSVYALIVSRRNYLVLFFLIPLVLSGGIYSTYVLYALQGKPINGIPENEVEIVWVELANPDILFLARDTETGGTPVYYRIPYTEENVEQMAEIMQQMEQGGIPTGTFESNSSDSEDMIRFTPPPSTPQRPKN